ncbi:RNA 2',3'-cyclic phosphodiesterase [Raineyella sp. LH-20]|uniref:RNA 2',3'-cyclic phosphodiesterase n=1 Tax=Raineyella sp. LH-20 TaxID=3081204 RepID=UPI002953AFB4|nr:RNA 2',3'-cyclic phosphodiesterase [Raineyella sp. LH-20]WOP18233.1 RNA 2',3'-cyclic phosphodiesterase [Raineyella sp. LH-20]
MSTPDGPAPQPETRRLFLALVPDTAATEVLARWLSVPANGPLPTGWRAMAAPTWHVTLAFLAAVDTWAYGRLVDRITRIASRAVPLSLDWAPPGAFPRAGAARVAWIGVRDHPAPTMTLAALARACHHAATAAGAAPDHAAFRPHLTVGRSGQARDLTDYLALPGAPAGPAWVADRILLVESQLGKGERGRPRYVERAEWPLGASTPTYVSDPYLPAVE